jgi:hypothetical protein
MNSPHANRERTQRAEVQADAMVEQTSENERAADTVSEIPALFSSYLPKNLPSSHGPK